MRIRTVLPLAATTLLAAPAVASATFLHVVAPGESLGSVAAADGLSVSQLAAANGISPATGLTTGSTLAIPPQGPSVPAHAMTTASAAAAGSRVGDGDADSDGPVAAVAAAAPPAHSASTSAAPASTTAPTASGSYVVQPGDTLSAIAARAGTTVSRLAAANGLASAGLLPAGIALRLWPTTVVSPVPTQAPAVGTAITGRMTWFGGVHDRGAQGIPASGLGWRSDGMSFYNRGSLGHRWLLRFPWGQMLNMSQIDIGPAPWTGNPFDIAFSALPNTPYHWWNWPNPVVTGIYQGG